MTADSEAPPVMGMDERAAWAQLVATTVSFTAYAIVVVPRVMRLPVAEVSWVPPMLVALCASLAVSFVGAALAGVAGTLRVRGRDVATELGTDARDSQIAAFARIRAYGFYAALAAGALCLAMIGADRFWIGNWVFLMGTVASIVEAAARLRAYRRGLPA